jgi:mRNA interferase MazF
MKKPSAICNRFDIVVVTFPFSDIGIVRKRPALVLTSFEDFGDPTGTAVLAMITSAKRSSWPYDVPITNLGSAGLKMPCFVRMKLISVAIPRIELRIGSLSGADQASISHALLSLFAVGPVQ